MMRVTRLVSRGSRSVEDNASAMSWDDLAEDSFGFLREGGRFRDAVPARDELQHISNALERGLKTRRKYRMGHKGASRFSGYDAVDFLVDNSYANSREHALHIGRALACEFGLFEHETRDHDLEDEKKLLYIFTSLDQRNVGSDSRGLSSSSHSLHAIADAFEEGVVAGSTVYKNKTYNDTFVGSTAVSWLVSAGFAKTRQDAVRMGQLLVEEYDMFQHVESKHKFKDRDLLYQFVSKNRRVKERNANCIEESAQHFIDAVKPGSTFSGSSAVDTIVNIGLASSRSEAVLLGERLASDLKLFHCVQEKRRSFLDRPDIYYAYSEGDKTASPSSSLQWLSGSDADTLPQFGDNPSEFSSVKSSAAKQPEAEPETVGDTMEETSNISCDKFGFILDGGDDVASIGSRDCNESVVPIEEELSTEEWKDLIQNCAPEDSAEWPTAMKDKAKHLMRIGLPDSLRRHAWTVVTGVDRVVQERESEYELLVERATRLMNDPSERLKKGVIERDLHRTFPRHIMFCNTNEEDGRNDLATNGPAMNGQSKEELVPNGVASLRRILYAYAIFDDEIGYCQGMNFIAGLLLTFLPEVEAYWMLVAIMNKAPCGMRRLFAEDMNGVREMLHIAKRVIQKFLPKLYRHLEREQVDLSMFATQWFMTVYASTFRFDLVARVWDSFLVEGWKVVFRVMISLLEHAQRDLMGLDMEDILTYMRDDFPTNIDGPSIVKASLKIPLRQKHLRKYANEWRADKKKDKGLLAKESSSSAKPKKILSMRRYESNGKLVKGNDLQHMARQASF